MFLENIKHVSKLSIFDKYGRMGVEALRRSTPVDTGNTANAWYYKVNTRDDGVTIEWLNSNVNDGVNIAVILQYGHGTGTGGYVTGRDYINPALQPIFDQITEELWEEVKNS